MLSFATEHHAQLLASSKPRALLQPLHTALPRTNAVQGQESHQRVNGAKNGFSLPRYPIKIAFTPTLEGEVVFNLKCDVKRKTEPLSLNIKATGYSMSVSVRCENSDGGVTELSAQEVNVIDFKEVSSSPCSARSCKMEPQPGALQKCLSRREDIS